MAYLNFRDSSSIALVSASSQVMRNSAEKVRSTGNPNVMVCERGTMFGYADLIVDPRNLVWMRDANCPVVSGCSSLYYFLTLSIFPLLLVLLCWHSHVPRCLQVADITHSLQQPSSRAIGQGGIASGGLRDMIPSVARACVAVGVDGIFMEVHDNPTTSPVDGPTQWPLRNLEALLAELVEISKASKVGPRLWRQPRNTEIFFTRGKSPLISTFAPCEHEPSFFATT